MEQTTSSLSKLLFYIFIYICGTERRISARDAQRLRQLITNLHWVQYASLEKAILDLRRDYSRLWSEYTSSDHSIEISLIDESLGSNWSKLSGMDALDFQESLEEFVRKLHAHDSREQTGRGLQRGEAVRQVQSLFRRYFADPKPEAPSDVSRKDPKLSGAPDLQQLPPSDVPPSAVWVNGPLRVRCIRVVTEAPDVKTYHINAADGRSFNYKPGQFIVIRITVDGRVLRKSYTLSSSPSRPHVASISVKRVLNGEVSNWLYDNMAEGVEFDINGPYGEFTCANYPADKLLLISAGSGVTPMISMLRHISDTSAGADIVFINNVRTQRDVIFESELHYIGVQLGQALKLAVVPAARISGAAWNGPVGRFSDALLLALASDFQERETFVCGPAGYMAAVRAIFERLEYPMSKYHEESFGGAPKPAVVDDQNRESSVKAPSPIQVSTAPVLSKPPPATPTRAVPAAPAPPSIEVTFQRSGVTTMCSSGSVLLEVAESTGVRVDSSCRSGVCGTCRVRALKGTLSIEGESALTSEDIEDGFVLACISTISEPVVLDA